ncbi:MULTISPECIES: tyrosine-type recombinase/integrase [Roseomonadaceae]|uniref:Integrase arm-type DNA-binding domain-containing protein n=1 Tax=Falsiroseomonas oleicola TaxID=2801474 RepID=A0ABS6HAN4_9PROT|nr:integrase arm-type DNA-binding domain-containing protein [Roseomonas oleicola]MBU8545776.1 integrase arm-type DNA-binding domain-containing protein [Roseomonas oleicola]
MPRIVHHALTDAAVKALVKKGDPGRHADGAGLYLHVTGQGKAKWALRYMVAGKSRELGLGPVIRGSGKTAVGVSLAEARIASKAARVKLDAGGDPVEERRAAEAARRADDTRRRAAALTGSPGRSFNSAFEAWFEAHGPAMRTERQRKLTKALIVNHVTPAIGHVPVAEVATADMLRVLQPIWRKKPETALRVRIRCEAVLAWAKASGWRQGENPAIWKDNLAPLLGRQGEVARVRHHRALHWRDVPAFMARLANEESVSAMALRWVILTAARTSEAIGATWDEIDLKAPGGPIWTVLASRMKMGAEHRVPLSTAALAVLEAARPLRTAGEDEPALLFPGRAGSRGGAVAGGRADAVQGGLSNMALLLLLRRMGVAGYCTVHGFRSSFRDWTAECTATPEAVAEAALAHAVGNQVQRAYQRGDLLEKRRVLMATWASFLATPPATVSHLKDARERPVPDSLRRAATAP